MGMQWGVSGVIGPAVAGTMIDADLGVLWVVLMALGALIPIQLFRGVRSSSSDTYS
jgi:hypothetical protein